MICWGIYGAHFLMYVKNNRIFLKLLSFENGKFLVEFCNEGFFELGNNCLALVIRGGVKIPNDEMSNDCKIRNLRMQH